MAHLIQGDVTSAVCYGNHPDPKELGQIYGMLRNEAFRDGVVRIMPDHHPGKGCLVGLTLRIPSHRKVIPAVIGTDIGCGVQSTRLDGLTRKDLQMEDLDRFIRLNIPVGASQRASPSKRAKWLFEWGVGSGPYEDYQQKIRNLCQKTKADIQKVWCQLGTLGGGNHFIEVGEDQAGILWLTIHSGSRGLGLKVCETHQRFATQHSGRQNGLEWLEGIGTEQYLTDMRLAQQYAQLNRYVMTDLIVEYFGLKIKTLDTIESTHNYIDPHDMVRKGAVSAREGESVLIPLNMAEGILVGIGLGNEDWNQSAPHGAGRRLSRSEAREQIPMSLYRERMQGVWSSCIHNSTVDESPDAYKDSAEIRDSIGQTVRLTDHIRPLYNHKAGGEHY